MAEEILYDQVETGGDPDPLGLRRQLKAVKQVKSTPDSAGDPLGLRAKLTVSKIKSQQPEAPSFKVASDWLALPQGYQPMVAENVVQQDAHEVKTAQSKSRVQEHLIDMDKSVENLIRNHKKELTGRLKSQQLGMQPRESGPVNFQAQQIEKQLEQEIPVDVREVEEFKGGMNENPVMLRQGLNQKVKDLSKYDRDKANILKTDIYRIDRQDAPEKEAKVTENIEKIKSGEYDYDVVNGRLIKPEGFFGSLATSYKEKGKAYDDYDVYQSGDEKKIMARIKQRLNDDPDKAVPTPSGASGHAGAMLGGQPLKPLIGAGIAGFFTGGTGAAAAGAAISSPEMYKLAFGSLLPHNYAALKKKNPTLSDSDVLQQAIDLTNSQANTDAFVGAAMGAFAAKSGFASTGLKKGLLHKSLGSALLQIGEVGAKKTLEGLGIGSIGAVGQAIKNTQAQKAGIQIEDTEGVAEQLIGGVGMTMGMTLIAKFPKLLKPKTYNQLLQAIKGVPDEITTEQLSQLQEVGEITPEQAQQAQAALKEQQAIDRSIKPDVPESDRLKIQGKIKQRNDLEASLETADKAYHPDIKEQIKSLNEEIVNISKGAERGELQKLIDAENKEGKIAGVMSKTLADASESDLKTYMKDISKQASDPATTQATIDTFGENIVKKAMELFPKEAPKESKISIIQPGEIKQPETITIKPKENAVSVEKPDAVDVRQQAGDGEAMGEGNVQPEIPAGEESGRPAETQGAPAGQEKVADDGGFGEGEPRAVGITHAQMDVISEELGLPRYEGSPEKQTEWAEQAAKKLATDPNALPDLFDKLRKGIPPDAVETKMMGQYFADIMAKVGRDPYNTQLQNQLLRTKDLFNIAGRIQGKALVARKGFWPVEESLGDFILKDREVNKAPLTEKQTTQAVKEFEEIKSVKDKLQEKVAVREDEVVATEAQKEIEIIDKNTKKGAKKDYQAERKKIIGDISKKWNESKSQTSVTILPLAKELIAITPDVMKLVKNLVEEGVEKLPDIIKAVHNQIKQHIPEITEKNIHDIVAGEYNKRRTRTEVAEKVFDLRTEARLINELQKLENGEQPKTDRAKKKRNRQVEALREKIKGLKDETGDRLEAYKKRIQGEINKLEEELKAGDFKAPTEPIKLDEEAQALKDKMLELREERQVRLLKLEYETRSPAEKAATVVGKALNTGRTAQSSFDVSYPFRQTIVGLSRQLLKIPFEKRDSKWLYTGFKAQKQLADQFGKMYQSFGSKRIYRQVVDEYTSHPDYKKWQEAGLNMADPFSPMNAAKEELFQSSYAEDIPVVKRGIRASHRAATVIANKMKWDIANQLAEGYKWDGKTFENSPELYEATAKYVNQLVARGYLGKSVEMASPVISHFVYSLRMQMARLQFLTYLVNPRFYTKAVPKEIRIEYLKDMAKFMALSGTVMGLANAAGLQVGLDPRSSDFGTIMVGNTRFDIWGGFKQYVTLAARLMSSSTVSPETGKTTVLEPGFGKRTHGDVVLRFLRTKASPLAGMVTDVLVGETFDRKPVTFTKFITDKGGVNWDNEILKFITPLIGKDIAAAYNDGGVQRALLTMLLATHGVGVQTHEEEEKKQSVAQSPRRGKQTTRRKNPHKKH